MKTRTKKCGVYAALAAVLLITAALVTSCPESLSLGGLTIPQDKQPGTFVPPQGKQPVATQPPTGGQPDVILPPDGGQPAAVQPTENKAYLRVNFGSSSNGRTIMPTFVANHYVLTATHTGPGTPSEPSKSTEVEGTETSGFLPLTENQTYSVSVIAYATSGETAPIASGATTTDVTAIDGAETTIALSLSTGLTGTGTFKWNITLPTTPSTLDTAKLTLSTSVGGSGVTDLDEVDLLSGGNINSTGISVPADVYYVMVEVTAADHANYKKMDIVHIFGNLPTTYTDSLPDLAENTYTVTYANYNGLGSAAIKVDPTKRQHASTIIDYMTVANGGGLPALDSTITGNTSHPLFGCVFDKWYKESTVAPGTASTTPWVFSSDIILRPITLYGEWIQPIGINVTITPPSTGGTTFTLSTGNVNIPQTDLDVDTIPNIVITATISGDWKGFKWYKDNVLITGANTTTLTLSLARNQIPPPNGVIEIMFEATTDDTDEILYSGVLRLTITP